MDEDDDFYAPEEPEVQTTAAPSAAAATETKTEHQNDELEEGEEEDEGGEMDEDDDDDDSDSVTCVFGSSCYEHICLPAARTSRSLLSGKTAQKLPLHREYYY